MALGETVTVVNKSGKVVGTSKRLVGVFNEAKSAYNERKAELRAFRSGQWDKKEGKRPSSQYDGRDNERNRDRRDDDRRRDSKEYDRRRDGRDDERRARDRLETLSLDDRDSRSHISRRASSDGGRSRGSRHGGSDARSYRPPMARGVSDSFYTNDSPSRDQRRSSQQPPSPLRNEIDQEPRIGELTRRHTDGLTLDHRRPPPKPRSSSVDDIDMDLAYGDLPPPLPVRKYSDEVELRAKMTGLQRLLDECNCLQHSVTAIIDNLSKNPDNLAAVALTLAEISNLVSKMAPRALASMKGAFPAVVALLASPEFAIAAGAAVGVTIIALGGYKIIKKIQGKKMEEGHLLLPAGQERRLSAPESGTSDMESLREIDRIEHWRRGIPASDADSLGSTVEGELVTPRAARTLIQDGKLTEADLKSRTESDAQRKKKRSHRSSNSERESRSGGSSRSSGKTRPRKKEPSGLRMLFRSGTGKASVTGNGSSVA